MRDILGEELPDVLYRYRSWEVNENGINYTKDILKNNRFYLSAVDQLNDSFECTVVPSIEATPEEARERVAKLPRLADINDIDYEQEKEKFIYDAFYRETVIQLKNKEDRRKAGICCLAGSNHTKSLMWSHYADKHKGICLVFDTVMLMQSSRTTKLNILKVDYKEAYPKVNYIIDDLWKVVKAKFLTKEKCWEYEDEYRIVAVEADKDYPGRKYSFLPKALVKVILGDNMSPSDKCDCIETLKKRPSPVKLYQAVKKEREFGLEKKLIGIYGG